MSDPIPIRTITDILRVPAERRSVLLRDLEKWCALRDYVAQINAGPDGTLLHMNDDTMLWLDDDEDKAILRIEVRP